MIQNETMFASCDNSGLKTAKCIAVSHYQKKVPVGQKVTVANQRVVPNNPRKVKAGDVVPAVVIQSCQWGRNVAGLFYRGFYNRVTLLKKSDASLSVASRIFTRLPLKFKYIDLARLLPASRGYY